MMSPLRYAKPSAFRQAQAECGAFSVAEFARIPTFSRRCRKSCDFRYEFQNTSLPLDDRRFVIACEIPSLRLSQADNLTVFQRDE